MMANGHVLISSQTLGSTAASVTFSSIPGTYRDLQLVIVGKQDSTSGVDASFKVTANSDTTSSYTQVRMYGDGSAAGSNTGTNTGYFEGGRMGNSNASSGVTTTTLQFLDYAATDKQKTVLSRSANPYAITDAEAARWPSTSAITTLLLATLSGNFVAGSTFYLYGVLG
jgi:hypothetical protein